MAEFECGKLFVGGVSWETTEATLADHFRRYGEVSSSIIATDRSTGNPRGFAFVTFTDPSSADRALNDLHEISGRTVEVKKAKPRGELPNLHQSYRKSSISTEIDRQFRSRKIFVGGLSANLTEEEFKNYFAKFGRITDVVVMYDSVTNRPRGFGFITFDSEEAVEMIMRNSFHELGGKFVEVKRAIPKEASRNAGSNNQNLTTDVERASPCTGYWPENVHSGFYQSNGCVYTYGYNGGYGAGYQIAWPGFGSVGYGMMPMIAASNHWNGAGMISYGHLGYSSSPVYDMNAVSGAGAFGANNGVDNRLGISKLVPHIGSNFDVQDNSSGWENEGLRSNYNRSSTPKGRTQRGRSFDRKQKLLESGNRS